MQALQQLFYSDLPVPVWQIILYAGAISYFMIQRWFKLSFVTSFVLVLYWLHYAFRADLVSIISEDQLARALYYILGFALILMCIFALSFLEVDADSLLEKREKEITFLKAHARNAEKAAAGLKAQLEKDQSQDSSPKKKLGKKLNAKIDKLENELRETERLLKTRDAEISDLQDTVAEAQKSASAFEALLEMYQTQESNTKKQLEEELTTKLEALQSQLLEGESLLEIRDSKISELQARASEAETNVSALKTQLEQTRSNECTVLGKIEKELNATIAKLENELKQGETLLENRNSEITALRVKAAEAEKNASALKTQLEQCNETTANDEVHEEL
ncbi:MAG: hypothetical protein ACRD4B_02630, partial [Acidobacteriota bacterium]